MTNHARQTSFALARHGVESDEKPMKRTRQRDWARTRKTAQAGAGAEKQEVEMCDADVGLTHGWIYGYIGHVKALTF